MARLHRNQTFSPLHAISTFFFSRINYHITFLLSSQLLPPTKFCFLYCAPLLKSLVIIFFFIYFLKFHLHVIRFFPNWLPSRSKSNHCPLFPKWGSHHSLLLLFLHHYHLFTACRYPSLLAPDAKQSLDLI